MQIELHEHFYSSSECALVMDYVTRVERDRLWSRTLDSPFWDRRCVNCESIDVSPVVSLMRSKRAAIKELIRAAYGVKDELYSDLLQIVRWPPGCELRPHADSEESDGRPHPFPYREFASIIYLNDDFMGGQIYFPRQADARPIMTPGTLVFFPGTLPFLHGVEEVAAGTRYTIASFSTRDRSKADAYDRAQPDDRIGDERHPFPNGVILVIAEADGHIDTIDELLSPSRGSASVTGSMSIPTPVFPC